VRDIGAGVNFNRTDLRSLVQRCVKGLVCEVVVAHRDGLCRFGFELLELLFHTTGVYLVVDEGAESLGSAVKDDVQQLAEDLVAIDHVFSRRSYAKRKYEQKRQ
jgi:putative resolvase